MNSPGEGEPGAGLETIFSLILSWPSAVILITLCAFIAFLIVVFAPAARNKNLKLNLKEGSVESTPTSDTSDQDDRVGSSSSGSREIAVPENVGSVDNNLGTEEDKEKRDTESEENPFVEMLLADDEENLQNAYERYKCTVDEELADSLLHRLRIKIGVKGALSDLIELEKTQTAWSEPSEMLAQYYRSIEQFDVALRHIETGIARTQLASNKFRLIFTKVEILAEQKELKTAIDLLLELESSLGEEENELKARALGKLGNLYKDLGDFENMTAAYERALLIEPDNTDRRFNLAFEYSERRETALLACLHYRIITTQNDNKSLAHNNYGAVLGKLGAKSEEISAWKRGLGGDSDYPAGNLAIALADAGFLDEATEYLENLPPELRSGERATYATGYVAKKKTESIETKENLEASARQLHNFVIKTLEQNLEKEVIEIPTDDISGNWISTENEKISFSMEVDSEKLEGEWVTKNKIYAISAERTLAGITGRATETKHLQYGLGLLAIGATQQDSKPEWVRTHSGNDEYYFRLLIEDVNNLMGFRIHGPDLSAITLHRN